MIIKKYKINCMYIISSIFVFIMSFIRHIIGVESIDTLNRAYNKYK